MGFDIALIVLTYNSDLLKTIATLESAHMQRGVHFKVIIADDGSSNKNISLLESYMANSGFDAYEILDRSTNVGTVKNLREALDYADAPFAKPISPGDYLYESNSLSTVTHALAKDNLSFCFGRAVHYRNTGGTLEIINRKGPPLNTLCSGRTVDTHTLKKLQVRYGYSVQGASAAYKTEHLAEFLDILSANAIKLCEDYSTLLMLMQSLPGIFINHYLIWYEFGTGVSTNPANNGYQTLQSDRQKLLELLCHMYPHDPDVRAALKQAHSPQGTDLVTRLRRAARDPERALTSIKARALRRVERLPQVSIENYCQIMDATEKQLASLNPANAKD